MITKKGIKSFFSDLFNEEPKDVLPYWNEDNKTVQPLREVVVIKDKKSQTNKTIFLYIKSNPFEIRVNSTSSYSTSK